MLNVLLLILKAAIGYESDQAGQRVSWKKILFVSASLVAYVVPSLLLRWDEITGAEWLDFYKVIVPVTLGTYAAGKWVDGQNAPEGTGQPVEPTGRPAAETPPT